MPRRIRDEATLGDIRRAFAVYEVEVDNEYARDTAREYKREALRFIRWLEGEPIERGRYTQGLT